MCYCGCNNNNYDDNNNKNDNNNVCQDCDAKDETCCYIWSVIGICIPLIIIGFVSIPIILPPPFSASLIN